MCIRDSAGIDVTPQVAIRDEHGDLVGRVDFLVTGTKVVVAVSYTHLRAHETVLDLVCRLLLEKKKQKTNAVGS